MIITSDIASKHLDLEELTWDQVKESIKVKDYELFQIIEDISPTNDFTFLKARYPFGAKIVDNGILNLPLMSGAMLPITSNDIPEKVQNKLNYSPIPLAFLSNRASEVYIDNENRTFPLVLLSAGRLFGLFEITSILSGIVPEPNWSIASGSRFIFMLPDISQQSGYDRFANELGISIDPPSLLVDHGKVFAQLCNHSAYRNDWQSEVIFFTNKWFENSLNDPYWSMFYNYLFKYSSLQISRSYKDSTFETIWSFSKKSLANDGMHISPYLLNSIKHLIAVATGVMPGFCSANTSEEIAPTKLIQRLYTDVYQLDGYLPTLMHSYHQTKGNILRPSYYSLSFPTMFDDINNAKGDTLSDLYTIKKALNVLYKHNLQKNTGLPKSYSLLENVQYKLHHHDANDLDSMQSLIETDRSLSSDKQFFPERNICTNAEFFNGCIQVFSYFTPDQKYPYGYRILSGK